VAKSHSPAELETSLAKLANLQRLDQLRKEKEEAKNSVESYSYAVKNRIYDEEETVNAVTTEEQREAVLALVSETTEWLDDEGFDTTTEAYVEKKKKVEGLAEPIFERMAEAEARPKAIADAEKRLTDIRALMKKWEKSMPQVTEGERDDVFALCTAAEKWIEEKKESQAKVEPHEAPAFLAKSVDVQLKSVANLVTKLSRKPKPPPPKKVLNATNSTNTTDTNATDAANATEAGEEAAEDAPADEAPTEDAPASEEGGAEEAAKDEL